MEDIILYALVGFLAQMLDGALSMGYGITAATFLLSIGIPPAMASASVHITEVFTSGLSGLFHWKFGNVDKQLFKRLVVPGALGGILGAYVITSVSADAIKPFVAVYLLFLGTYLVWKGFHKKRQEKVVRTNIGLLGLVGGFLDSIGGGGWGAVVSGTMLARGNNPRTTVGSASVAEFFVSLMQSAVFLLTLSFLPLQVIFGLMIGGVIAAPLGAHLCRKLEARKLMVLAGTVIVLLNAGTLLSLVTAWIGQ